jgi:hypothetical protein
VQFFETLCSEFSNYSTFERNNVTRYLRYQRRPFQRGPLNLLGFSWSGLFGLLFLTFCDAGCSGLAGDHEHGLPRDR